MLAAKSPAALSAIIIMAAFSFSTAFAFPAFV